MTMVPRTYDVRNVDERPSEAGGTAPPLYS